MGSIAVWAAARRGRFVLGLVLCGAAETPALATNGERLARRWCAECHVVAPDQAKASADVPSFAAIAADPARSDEQLAAVLVNPAKAHSRMQSLDLSRADIADLVAWIRKQKP